jgi:putative addiction module CopG family antidote
MNVPIPPEFEAFAREQVAAGRYASEAEVVADALRAYLADREALLLDPAIAQLDSPVRSGSPEPRASSMMRIALRSVFQVLCSTPETAERRLQR